MKPNCLTGLLLIWFFPASAQTIASDSLVLYLPFNGNAQDESGNGYHGVVNGATLTSGPTNQPNTAYYFDGVSNAIIIPNLKKLDGALKAFTILIRIQPQHLKRDSSVQAPFTSSYNFLTWHRASNDSTLAFLMSKMRTAWQAPSSGIDPDKGFLGYIMSWCSGNSQTASGYQRDTAQVIQQWHTIAYVYNSGSLTVYHNCKQENNWPGIYPSVSDLCGTEAMQITLGSVPRGAYQYGFRPFQGKIDELRVYTRALSEKDVEAFAGERCTEVPRVLRPAFSVRQDPCFPQQFQLADTTLVDTGFQVLRRVWRLGNGDTSNAATFAYRFAAAGSYPLSLRLFTNRGEFHKDTLLQVPFAGPRRFLQADLNQITLCEGGERQVQLQGGTSYQWQPCLYLSDCAGANPVIRATENTRYTVIAKDGFACADTTTIQVTVLPDNQPIYIPTGFTPNGDGLNDGFGVHSTQPLADFHLQVFNRWGQMVFETKKQVVKWNGRLGGKVAPSGAYVWRLTYTNGNGCMMREKKGTVLLLQ